MEHIHWGLTLPITGAVLVVALWVRHVSKQLDEVIDKHNNLAMGLTMLIQALEEDEEYER